MYVAFRAAPPRTEEYFRGVGKSGFELSSIKRAAGHVIRPYPVRDLPTGEYLELPGRGTTYITDSGPKDGLVLFLLHSVSTTGLLCWYPVIPELNSTYRVITIDHRWHGRGIRSDDFSLDDCADDAVAVADALGIDSFIAAGFSMGGGIAQLAWRRHADRVGGLVLCSTGPFFSSHDPENLAVDMRVASVAQRLDRYLPVPTDQRLNDTTGRHPFRWAMAQVLSTPLTKLGQFSEAMAVFDSRDWLGEVNIPTSVVVSTRDKVVPPQRQELLLNGIPDAQFFGVDGGHACCVVGAERFVPKFVDAVDSVAQRSLAARPIILG